ncbi:hypothetical protein D1007_41436 [Hordeum vulgare]|nr:hypothetical protein D1007_41436 [Hordeum vulgare]
MIVEHSASQPLPPPKMPGPIVHNETTTTDQGGFVAILANLTHRAFAMEEPLLYVVYQEDTSDAIRYFWDRVHIYGRSVIQERPHRFTGRTTSYDPEAIQLAAREAIVQLRHLSPRVNCRSFHYYPSHEGYGRPLQVTSRDHETDPALLHLVRYLRAQEALYDQVTLDLLVTREELACLDPRRREVEPDASNYVVFFGRPIELLSARRSSLFSRNPMLIRLVQYVIARERLTHHMMDFLRTLAVQNLEIAIGEPLRIDPAGHILRVLQPFAPEEEVDIPLLGIFPLDR